VVDFSEVREPRRDRVGDVFAVGVVPRHKGWAPFTIWS
jgi:hypothetical protein